MNRRVLIVNKFYYPRGGDCVCTLNLESMLKSNGFDVMTYAMNYPENIKCDGDKYFATNVDFSGGISQKIKAIKRIFGYGDIVASFRRVLKEFNPDVVHLQNIHSYLSPIVAKLAKQHGCKVVWTMHDYKLLCPSYSCLNNEKPCELCFTDKKNVLKYKCMKGSTLASILAYAEAKKWNKTLLEKYTDAFVCPSQFMKNKMALGGFDETKLHRICNFIDPEKATILDNIDCCNNKEDYYVYVGRLSSEKGIATLVKVASKLPYTLKIAGGGPLLEELKSMCTNNSNIQFLGHLNGSEISNLVSKARFSVIPSECYENNPLSLIEALYAGTPVIGANIGGIPELINEDNGLIFASGSTEELSYAIKKMVTQNWDYEAIKDDAKNEFSSKNYLKKLINIY